MELTEENKKYPLIRRRFYLDYKVYPFEEFPPNRDVTIHSILRLMARISPVRVFLFVRIYSVHCF